MKSVNFYEVGVDPLPIVGLEIGYYDKRSSFGMFQSLDACSGTVELAGNEEYPDSEINIDEEGFDEWGEPVAKTMFVGEEEQIRRGLIWCYLHDYYAVVDPDMFAFQTYNQFMIAVKHNLIDVLDTVETEHVDREGLKYKNKVFTVYNSSRKIKVKFYCYEKGGMFRDKDWHFSSYWDAKFDKEPMHY